MAYISPSFSMACMVTDLSNIALFQGPYGWFNRLLEGLLPRVWKYGRMTYISVPCSGHSRIERPCADTVAYIQYGGRRQKAISITQKVCVLTLLGEGTNNESNCNSKSDSNDESDNKNNHKNSRTNNNSNGSDSSEWEED